MIIFTSGCFDILHRGHLSLLQYCHDVKQMKEMSDKSGRLVGSCTVIVGLNSDDSVRKLKGDGRPIMKEADRQYALNSLRYIDEVHLFNEPTPRELIERIKPDLIVKTSPNPEETGDVRVKIIPKLEQYSTTNLINEILSSRR